jgi:hypothetical protein
LSDLSDRSDLSDKFALCVVTTLRTGVANLRNFIVFLLVQFSRDHHLYVAEAVQQGGFDLQQMCDIHSGFRILPHPPFFVFQRGGQQIDSVPRALRRRCVIRHARKE